MLLLDTMRGLKVKRVPAVPKIWLDESATIMGRPFDIFFNNSALAAQTVIEAAIKCRADGARLFLFPLRDVEYESGKCYQVRGGRRLGQIDLSGGWATQLQDPDDFDFDDPRVIIAYQLFRCHEPIIKGIADLDKFRVPELSVYREQFDGDVKTALDAASGKTEIMGDCNSGTLAFCASLIGLTQTMYAMYDEPEFLHALMEKGVSLAIRQAEYLLEKGVRILRYNDSVANMNVVSPACWREFVFPHIKRFCDEVHRINREAIIYCHICGNVMPIVDDLLECGLDCIAPLDPLGGVSVAKIREKVGPQFMLMGGVNTLSFIQNTPDEVRSEAKRVIREGMPPDGGHFAVGSGCVVPRGAPVETIRALYEATEEIAKEDGI